MIEHGGLRLHHVGYVVPDIPSGAAGFVHSLGARWDGRVYDDPIQNVRVAFVVIRPGEAMVELVEPAENRSPVRHFLQTKGGGLHHLCYEVADIDQTMTEMRSLGSRIARRPRPAVAFEGRRIAWMLTPENLLVELLERKAEDSNNEPGKRLGA